MAIYKPRVHAQISYPSNEDEDDVIIPLLVKNIDISKNDHNSADTCRVTSDALAFGASGIDPRLFANTIMTVYLGQADDQNEWQPNDEDIQFIGRVSKTERSNDEDEATTIQFDCVDYTSFFILAKPFATDGVPDFSMTLPDAWKLICENTPGAEELSENIIFAGVDKNLVIGDSVDIRFKQAGKIVVQQGDSAWKVWQQVVGALGLISYFKLDDCIVTNSQSHYREDNPATFVYGKDIISFKEERNNDFERRGIGISSFDPITNKTLIAVFPPFGDARVNKGKQPKSAVTPGRKDGRGRKKKKTPTIKKDNEDRDWFQCPGGTTDLDLLQQIAERVYDERSRQEFRGSIKTIEMMINDSNGNQLNILNLKQGETIRIKIDDIDFFSDDSDFKQKSIAEKTAEYIRLDYQPEFAKILAENSADIAKLRSEFFIREIKTSFSVDENGGKFEVEIDYCNKIVNTETSGNNTGNTEDIK
jgi:hypothetical protein